MSNTIAPTSDGGVVLRDAQGTRYLPETLPGGFLATYLTRRQIALLLAYEGELAGRGQPHGPTAPLLAAERRIAAIPDWPAHPDEPTSGTEPTFVPLRPAPGLLSVALNAAECQHLACGYIDGAEGQPPDRAWQMDRMAALYADYAAYLDPKQFGHLRGMVSPRTDGSA